MFTRLAWIGWTGAALLSITAGCASIARHGPPAGAVRTLRHDGLDRTYVVHLPASYAEGKAYPLVLVLHGGGGEASSTARLTSMNRIADEHGFIVVYPNGIERVWNDGRGVERYRSQREDIDDVGFIAALIDELVSDGAVDRDRVYVTGLSNGGFMANRLGCQLADRVTAIAPVIASMAENVPETCDPSRAMPVLIVNGTADPLVPWHGHEVRFGRRRFGRMLSTPELVRFWVSHNGCDSDATVSWKPDRDPDDRTRVRVHVYSGCRDDVEVLLYEIQGGGHTWPGGSQYLPRFLIGRVSRDIIGSRVVWRFFSSY
ncbi:MAG: PHB depolymerase family esterase [Gemmatimonadales bacterium]|jgi:polyhydroxybutyrate depolymerase